MGQRSDSGYNTLYDDLAARDRARTEAFPETSSTMGATDVYLM